MRLALHNPFPPQAPWAERELALRLRIAAEALGWQAEILHDPAAIEAMAPDAVLCLHPQAVPKMVAAPSLACHWNPPAHAAGRPEAQANELSHDAFLVAGDGMAHYVRQGLADAARPLPMLEFHPSSQGWNLPPGLAPDSRLFYVGSGWDGRRFPALLAALAARDALALYGRADRWAHLGTGWRGELPFDGVSVIRAASACGIGLCLHLPAHRAAGIPNMRLFELCAAGALAICDDHPFIRRHFGDAVLYVDVTQGEAGIAEQVLDHLSWARRHITAGRAMAAEAQRIFLERFSLERLLAPLSGLLASLRAGPPPAHPRIAAVLPVGAGGAADAAARLAALAAQECRPVEVIIAGPGAAALPIPPGLDGVTALELPAEGGEGAILWAGLRRATAPLLCWLPDGARPMPFHLAGLAAALADGPADLAIGDVLAPCAEPTALGLTDPLSRPIQPWRLAAGPQPAGLLVRRDVLLPLLADEPSLDRLAGLLLARQLTEGVNVARTRLPSLRLERLPEADAVEWLVLDRLAPPAPAPAADPPAPAPVTGAADLNPAAASALPRLETGADIARLLTAGRPVWLYGASRGGALVLAALHQAGIEVAGFLDSFSDGSAHGLPVRRVDGLTPDALAGAYLVIANQYVSDCLARLAHLTPAPHILNAYPLIHRLNGG